MCPHSWYPLPLVLQGSSDTSIYLRLLLAYVSSKNNGIPFALTFCILTRYLHLQSVMSHLSTNIFLSSHHHHHHQSCTHIVCIHPSIHPVWPVTFLPRLSTSVSFLLGSILFSNDGNLPIHLYSFFFLIFPV